MTLEEKLDMILAKQNRKMNDRPMLATALADKDLDKLKFPFYASAKIDGYRGVYSGGVFYARSGKEHKAPAIQALAKKLLECNAPQLDGEFIIPDEPFNTAGGKLRRLDYTGPVQFIVFDVMMDGLPFANRYQLYSQLDLPAECKKLGQFWVEDKETLLKFESEVLSRGFEGVVVRKPSAMYKHGRGTLNDQIMLKLKRFKTAEAKVISVEPKMHNENEMGTTPLGYAERSSAKDGLVATDEMGTMHVVGINGPYEGVHFSIGTFDGLDANDKRYFLENPPVGDIITYKYFPTGAKDKPRHPVFLVFRPNWDMDADEVEDKRQWDMVKAQVAKESEVADGKRS